MSFDEMLKSLQQDYLNSLPEKIKIIEQQVKLGESDSVRESFHKLKGTGRTYGLPEVSELADLVETICLQAPQQSIVAAKGALPVLRDIYQTRVTSVAYIFATDPRIVHLRKLLQNESLKV